MSAPTISSFIMKPLSRRSAPKVIPVIELPISIQTAVLHIGANTRALRIEEQKKIS